MVHSLTEGERKTRSLRKRERKADDISNLNPLQYQPNYKVLFVQPVKHLMRSCTKSDYLGLKTEKEKDHKARETEKSGIIILYFVVASFLWIYIQ